MRWNSSNPILGNKDAFSEFYGQTAVEKSNVTTVSGVINKTAILGAIAIGGGIGGFTLVQQVPSLLWISSITAFIVVIGVGMVLRTRPQLSPILAPPYALIEGFFLGAFTAMAEYIVQSRGYTVAGGVALQAFIITGGVLVSLLTLYKLRIIRPTEKLRAVVYTVVGAIGLAYILQFVLAAFFDIGIPFFGLQSLTDTGTSGLIGLGLNVFILGFVSLMLVFDFARVEQQVQAAAPKYMEWYCSFALIVTLAWVYFEAVKIVIRVAALTGRD